MTDPLNTAPSAVPTDSTNDYRVDKPPTCKGCGSHAHGPVGLQIHCLEQALLMERSYARGLRATIADLLARIEPYEKLRAEVAQLRMPVLP
jgi:hypothetical protein